MSIRSVYIHIPFCSTICSYCDFYKMIAKQTTIEQYIKVLCDEIEMNHHQYSTVKTVYIGGGTPSSLSFALIFKLLTTITTYLPMNQIEEFTIEANPLDITEDYLLLLMKFGVNRLSLGIQSSNSSTLLLLKRNHLYDDVVNALSITKKVSFPNVSVDLLYAVGGDEEFSRIKADIELCVDFGVTHFSCYSLILEDKTLLHHWYKNNLFHPMNEDKEYLIYKNVVKLLKVLGYEQYEISNFSLPGYQSKHNLTYWNYDEYLGLGASSSSFYLGKRTKNFANLKLYRESISNKKIPIQEESNLSLKEQMNEYLMVGLRKIKGISLSDFKERFSKNLLDVFPNIQNLVTQGYLSINKFTLKIPSKYLYVQNAILSNFI